MSNHRWIGEARPRENPDQRPDTLEAATREEVEEWASEKRKLNYEVKIFPKPS